MRKDPFEQALLQFFSPSAEPGETLNHRVKNAIKERTAMHKRAKTFYAAIVAAAVIIILSATAFAAVKLLTPKDVAEHMGFAVLAGAFEGPDAILIDETQTTGGYKVILHGMVSGKDLTGEFQGAQEGKTYAVLTIEKEDGSPMPDVDEEGYIDFFASPLVKGLEPWRFNIAVMGGGYSFDVIDGVQYRLIQCDDVEIFADRGAYLCVISSERTSFYDIDALHYDEATGEMTRNEAYGGVNALFHLPLNRAKADPAKAEAYLKELNEPGPSAEPEPTPEPIQGGRVIEATRQTLVPDQDGMLHFEYDTEFGGGNVTRMLDDVFGDQPDGPAEVRVIWSSSSGADMREDVVEVWFARDAAGVITGYIVVEEDVKP